jgi:2-C-methyl-D-erythritol 2,4-cyclodiphosphate synthase
VQTSFRTGFGYDIHRLVAGRPLMLAGVKVEHSKGLLGHSDGDVILHAVCDALLGAAGAGEIGEYFPPTDAAFKGIASSEIVRKVTAVLKSRHGWIQHLDVSVVAEEPKLQVQYARLKASLSQLLRVPMEKINLKAKSNEGLGDIGRGEAIACYAVATLSF